MNDKDDKKKDDGEDLGSQLQEMLKSAQVQFMQFPGANAPNPSGDDNEPVPDDEKTNSEILEKIRSFQLKPREIRDYLDRFVN